MKKIILILSLLILANCGYQSTLSTKDANFKINKIEIANSDKISLKIKKRLKIYNKIDSIEKIYNLKINSTKNIKVSSKDAKGDPLTYEMTILTVLEIFDKDQFIKKIKYKKKFNYNNKSNKFDLKQFEKNTLDNLINQISENIIINLLSI
tara:strand:- start:629 stop:1081 length:453 start_codon:yes stop_codon:yes gene_type:complete